MSHVKRDITVKEWVMSHVTRRISVTISHPWMSHVSRQKRYISDNNTLINEVCHTSNLVWLWQYHINKWGMSHFGKKKKYSSDNAKLMSRHRVLIERVETVSCYILHKTNCVAGCYRRWQNTRVIWWACCWAAQCVAVCCKVLQTLTRNENLWFACC